jgi:Zn-dependent protease with chaperone function
MFAMAYWMNQSHHQELIQQAVHVTPTSAPEVDNLIRVCSERLQPGPVEVYVSREPQLNAYTFGITSPKMIVLYAPLFSIMDEDELAFVIGHEMGHITLGHTWLNTILGGMAGIPASFGAAILLTVVFRSWNRACEYSADRAGMLACKNPSKAISALLKLVSGERSLDQVEMTDLIRVLDREDDNLDGQFSEILSSHPLVIKRINQIREYASSREYSNLLNSIR